MAGSLLVEGHLNRQRIGATLGLLVASVRAAGGEKKAA